MVEVKTIIQEIPSKKLEWGEVSDKQMNWFEAKKWCEEKGKGWRLPTRVELLQAFDEKIEGFKGYTFWSSTEGYNNTDNAWGVYLSGGFSYYSTKVTAYYVRACRQI